MQLNNYVLQINMINNQPILTIENFLTAQETYELIRLSETNGYNEATVNIDGTQKMIKNIRNNDRYIYDNTDFAEELWPDVLPYANQILPDKTPICLNERFRFYRYSSEQRFNRHIDGSVTKENGLKSYVTLMIYLNDNFEGGETVFRNRGEKPGSKSEVIIEPKQGMALLFHHPLWHEGKAVTSGIKYAIRSDIFYK